MPERRSQRQILPRTRPRSRQTGCARNDGGAGCERAAAAHSSQPTAIAGHAPPSCGCGVPCRDAPSAVPGRLASRRRPRAALARSAVAARTTICPRTRTVPVRVARSCWGAAVVCPRPCWHATALGWAGG
eukprot:3056490-Prymnesium_polylepis.1